MSKPRVLVIEGKRTGHPSFTAGLTKKSFLVESVSSGAAALAQLDTTVPSLIIVDASSMRSSGKRICQAIHQKQPNLPLILVLDSNADPSDHYEADVVLVLPFTLQKLVNRVRILLPLENKSSLQTGPISLDVVQKRAIINGRQIQLTPRLNLLLRILMERAGEVVDRNSLFREAWDTDYTDDTRSLDVHISWLRQAIEENPRYPKYLITIRGVGYRLDTEPSKKQRSKRSTNQ
ncbi:MAG: response regulator transcription factor [Anaerolineaceae bacterium]|nr:response regulator transcription factor [Anaerolineaceae bacterium]